MKQLQKSSLKFRKGPGAFRQLGFQPRLTALRLETLPRLSPPVYELTEVGPRGCEGVHCVAAARAPPRQNGEEFQKRSFQLITEHLTLCLTISKT